MPETEKIKRKSPPSEVSCGLMSTKNQRSCLPLIFFSCKKNSFYGRERFRLHKKNPKNWRRENEKNLIKLSVSDRQIQYISDVFLESVFCRSRSQGRYWFLHDSNFQFHWNDQQLLTIVLAFAYLLRLKKSFQKIMLCPKIGMFNSDAFYGWQTGTLVWWLSGFNIKVLFLLFTILIVNWLCDPEPSKRFSCRNSLLFGGTHGKVKRARKSALSLPTLNTKNRYNHFGVRKWGNGGSFSVHKSVVWHELWST